MTKLKAAKLILSDYHIWKLWHSEIELIKQLKFDLVTEHTGNRTLYHIQFSK
jgi:hypothetical protein